MADVGLLILRLVVGALVMGHGLQKLAGRFGGRGFERTAERMASLGLEPGRFWAAVAGLGEFGGGLLVTLGFLTPLGSLAVAATMLMAIVTVHWPRVWNADRGLEYPLTNIAIVVALALIGPGAYSMDHLTGLRLQVVPLLLVGLAGGLIVAGSAAVRRRAAPGHVTTSHRTIQLRR